MRIGELGEAAGVDVDTIRYYEKIGVLPPSARQSNGYRAYGPTHVKRLMFVRHCRALDMPLAEVQRLLGWTDSPQAPCADVDALIDKQLLRVRERLSSLRQLEAQLSDLRARCADTAERGDKAEACGILSDLMAAAQGEGCACHHEHIAAGPSDARAVARPS